jgi:hypothetical protein
LSQSGFDITEKSLNAVKFLSKRGNSPAWKGILMTASSFRPVLASHPTAKIHLYPIVFKGFRSSLWLMTVGEK